MKRVNLIRPCFLTRRRAGWGNTFPELPWMRIGWQVCALERKKSVNKSRLARRPKLCRSKVVNDFPGDIVNKREGSGCDSASHFHAPRTDNHAMRIGRTFVRILQY